MKYYTCKKKRRKIKPWMLIILLMILIINLAFMIFDKKVMPNVFEIAKLTMKNKTTQLISDVSMEAYNELFIRESVLDISTDKEGNINMIKANTMKLNKLNAIISKKCNEALDKMRSEGIKIPFGWVTNSSIYYEFGPDIKVNVDPIGNVSTKFVANFESAGINQTRYTVSLEVEAKLNVQVPLYMEEISVKTEVPLADAITVGKIPNTAIDLGSFGKENFQAIGKN